MANSRLESFNQQVSVAEHSHVKLYHVVEKKLRRDAQKANLLTPESE